MKARSLIEGSASRGIISELLKLNGTKMNIYGEAGSAAQAGRKF